MDIKSKRGISPVIATVLLIVIAIGLFIGIYAWISSINKESITKFGSDIRQSCLNLEFNAVYSSGNLEIQNNGNIVIWKVEVFRKSGGSLAKMPGINEPIQPQESASLSVSSCEQIKVIPVLLGTSQKTGLEKEYICDDRAKTIDC